jgi:hypothetical protein
MDREIRLLGLAALAAAILSPALAAAQQPPRAKSPLAPVTELRDPKACAQQHETVGKGGDGKSQDDRGQGTNLSDKLAQSNGVLCPPSDVDPRIKQPTPPQGNMPVIPPPGSQGGDRGVQPK